MGEEHWVIKIGDGIRNTKYVKWWDPKLETTVDLEKAVCYPSYGSAMRDLLTGAMERYILTRSARPVKIEPIKPQWMEVWDGREVKD